jgi:hypothetical protein
MVNKEFLCEIVRSVDRCSVSYDEWLLTSLKMSCTALRLLSCVYTQKTTA